MSSLSAVGRPWICGLTWLVYLAGPVASGLFFLHANKIALLLPIVAILVLIIVGIEGQDVAIETREEPIAKAKTLPLEMQLRVTKTAQQRKEEV